MLAFSPLASAPLGADAARLPQILAQAASAMALEGVGAARARISARKQSGTAANLPLGGHAKVHATVRGQGLAGLPLAGVARGKGAIGSRLQSDVPLSGGGGAQARVDATASDTLDLRDAAWSTVGVQGSAVTVFRLQRHAVAAVEVDVTAARSLPLVGHSAARLHGRGTAATTVVFGITASGKLRVALQGLGDFAFGGLAQAECHATGAIVASLTTAGAGVLAGLAAGRGAGGLAIGGVAGASSTAVARAEASVSVVGAGTSDVSGDGAGAIVFPFGLRADGRAALDAIIGGAVLLSGLATIGTSIAAQAWETGLSFTGQAAGTILKPREGAATGKFRVGGQGQAVSVLEGRGTGAIPVPGHSTAASTTRIVATGQLSLTRGIVAELQVTAKAGRTIVLAGAARATAPTSAGAQDLQLAVTGEARAHSDAIAIGGADLVLSRAVAASGAVTAAGHPDLDAELLILGRVGARATLAPALDLRGASVCVATHRLRAEGPIAWQARASGETASFGTALAGQTLTGGTVGAMAIHGAASSAFAVTRAFAGDVDVQGDSARQISLGGSASARTTSRTQTPQSLVEVTGNAGARATAAVEAAANVALPCSAKARVPAAATSSASIGWRAEAAATAPRSGQSQGMLSLVGPGQARSAARGAAVAGPLVIAGDLGGATGLIAELQVDLALEGTAEAAPSLAAQGTGKFAVARDSDAEVQVAADAARLLPIAGTAAGALAARATRVDGAVALVGSANAQVETAASLPTGATLDVQSHATGAARMQAICSGHVAFVRLGQADVLVAAGAAHGMTLLGAALASNVTRATAKLPLAPRLSGTATNVIRVEFAAREVTVVGLGNAILGVSGRAVARHLGLVAAVQALRAPPALRRSEPAKYGLSGRLMPTNSGRILRG